MTAPERIAGPTVSTLTTSDDSVPPGTEISLSVTMDDTQYNSSNGTEPSQNIQAAEYYIDTPPWVTDPTPEALPLLAVDGAFDSPIEQVGTLINTTDWTAGSHLIFVRGQDESGVWEAFSFLFIHIWTQGL